MRETRTWFRSPTPRRMERKGAENGKPREACVKEREMKVTTAHLIWVAASMTTKEVKVQVGILEASTAGRTAQASAFAVEMVMRS